MEKTLKPLSIAIVLALFLYGCSQGHGIIQPEVLPDVQGAQDSVSPHYIGGLWTLSVDPKGGKLDCMELRGAGLHINALPFLEPPVNLNLTIENVHFTGSTVECDVGLRNPFVGQEQYTGFDVCGIIITNGSLGGFSDPDIVMAGEGDTRLLNPDGLTRWWNPSEFPYTGTILGYKDGLWGTPYAQGQYNCTLNAYKYFCDDLTDPDDPLTKVSLSSRGMFSAGQKNMRHYAVDFSSGLIFNYAVDACWAKPKGDYPWTIPDDFPPVANRPEAWYASVTEVENTLWNDGGDSGGSLKLSIDVYDWFNAAENLVRVESPGNFDMVEVSEPIGGGEGYSTYEVDIPDAHPGPEYIDLLITVQSGAIGYGGLLPGKPVSAYFLNTSKVTTEHIPPAQFAYSSSKSGNYEVYLTDIDGSFETNLTNNPASDYMADFSPDGKILYFNSDRDGLTDVFALDMDTMEVTNITSDSLTHEYGADVSPDGEWLVTVQSWSVTDKDIFRLKADGSMSKNEWINLTNMSGYDHEPDWSPDGLKIAYYRIDGTGNDAWMMDSLDGGNKHKIVSGPGDEHCPKFSPDGDKVLYQSNKFGSQGLFYYSFSADQNYTYIDKNGVEELGGSFSPGGNFVIFVIGEPADIYYAPFPDAGEPIPLVTGSANDAWAVWRPGS